MVISYSCFHFKPKYYSLAASDGHCHNRLGPTRAKIESTNSECRTKTIVGSFMHAVRTYKRQAHG